jgi:hypothetical protein
LVLGVGQEWLEEPHLLVHFYLPQAAVLAEALTLTFFPAPVLAGLEGPGLVGK